MSKGLNYTSTESLRQPNIPATGFLRLAQVLTLIPVSRSAWYDGVAEGRYPAPVRLGPRTAAYRVEDIVALIERLGAQGADQGETS